MLSHCSILMLGTPEILLFTVTFAVIILGFYLIKGIIAFLNQPKK